MTDAVLRVPGRRKRPRRSARGGAARSRATSSRSSSTRPGSPTRSRRTRRDLEHRGELAARTSSRASRTWPRVIAGLVEEAAAAAVGRKELSSRARSRRCWSRRSMVIVPGMKLYSWFQPVAALRRGLVVGARADREGRPRGPRRRDRPRCAVRDHHRRREGRVRSRADGDARRPQAVAAHADVEPGHPRVREGRVHDDRRCGAGRDRRRPGRHHQRRTPAAAPGPER